MVDTAHTLQTGMRGSASACLFWQRESDLQFWGRVVPFTVLTLLCVLYVPSLWVPATYEPDMSVFVPEIKREVVRPEPLELLRGALALSFVPLLIWLICFIVVPSRWSAREDLQRFGIRTRMAQSVFLIFLIAGAYFQEAFVAFVFGSRTLDVVLAVVACSIWLMSRRAARSEVDSSRSSVLKELAASEDYKKLKLWFLRLLVEQASASSLVKGVKRIRSKVTQSRRLGAVCDCVSGSLRTSSAKDVLCSFVAACLARFVIVKDRLLAMDRRGLVPLGIVAAYLILQLSDCIFWGTQNVIAEYFEYHLSFQMGEFAAVLSGLTARVDYFPQYQGLLSYVLYPFFCAFGLSLFTFSLAMVSLSFVGLMIIFAVFRRVCRGAWTALLLFVPFVGLCFVEYRPLPYVTVQRLTSFSAYSIAPLRYFGIWATLGMLAYALDRPSGRRVRLLFFVAGCAALNNLDFGLPALIAAGVAILFASCPGGRPSIRSVCVTVANAASGVGVAYVGYLSIAYWRTGSAPRWDMMIVYQRAFAGYGFGMLPMPAFGLHWVIYATFMAAIATAFFSPVIDPMLKGLLLYAGVSGAGAAMYFVGRSHPDVLDSIFPAWGLCWSFLLVACARDCRIDPKTGAIRAPFGALPLAAIWLIAVICVLHTPSIKTQFGRYTAPRSGLAPEVAYESIVRNYTTPGEKVMIAFPWGYFVALQAGVVNVYPFTEALLRVQLDVVMQKIEEAHVRHVFSGRSPSFAQKLTDAGFHPVTSHEGLVVWERK